MSSFHTSIVKKRAYPGDIIMRNQCFPHPVRFNATRRALFHTSGVVIVAFVTLPGAFCGIKESTEWYYPHLHALCIGINRYQSQGIPQLSFAERDASRVSELLKHKYRFDSISLLMGKEATREGIEIAINRLYKVAESDDAVLIYFAGHGQNIQISEDNTSVYLVPYDASVTLGTVHTSVAPFNLTCISKFKIEEWKHSLRARHVLLIVDACYSGFLLSTRGVTASETIKDSLTRPCFELITGGVGDQLTREDPEKRSGVFTHHLVTTLEAPPETIIEDGFIRGSELGTYLSNIEIPGQSPQFQRDSESTGDFVLWPVGEPEEKPSTPTNSRQAFSRNPQSRPPENPCEGQEWDFVCPSGFHYPLSYVQGGKSTIGTDKKPEGIKLLKDFLLNQSWDSLSSIEPLIGRELDMSTKNIEGFWMGKYEVPLGMFRDFAEATNYRTFAEEEKYGYAFNPGEGVDKLVTGLCWWSPGFPQDESHPVVCISWQDANELGRWAGLSVPSEAQWERAARGGDGREFPWGDKSSMVAKCNVSPSVVLKEKWQDQDLPRYLDDGFLYTCPVTSFADGMSPYGCLNMAGNAAEWVSDSWTEASSRQPQSNARVRKGGAWISRSLEVRCASRDKTSEEFARTNYIGVRLCLGTRERNADKDSSTKATEK